MVNDSSITRLGALFSSLTTIAPTKKLCEKVKNFHGNSPTNRDSWLAKISRGNRSQLDGFNPYSFDGKSYAIYD